jgi:hypothetical protein
MLLLLWRIDPLLVKDLETNNETAVARQQAARQRIGWLAISLKHQQSTRNNTGTVGNCFLRGPCQGVSMGQV